MMWDFGAYYDPWYGIIMQAGTPHQQSSKRMTKSYVCVCQLYV